MLWQTAKGEPPPKMNKIQTNGKPRQDLFCFPHLRKLILLWFRIALIAFGPGQLTPFLHGACDCLVLMLSCWALMRIRELLLERLCCANLLDALKVLHDILEAKLWQLRWLRPDFSG